MHAQLERAFAQAGDLVCFHLQTVFEGEETNTPERGPREAKKFGSGAPVGYDAHVDGARVSTFMSRYGTGGTPWTTVIDRAGKVRFNGFTPEFDGLDGLIQKLLAEAPPKDH